VEAEHATLEKRREELVAELADVSAKSADAASRLQMALEERREFEVGLCTLHVE
jgi:hypothetical protein